jgi:diguanylate cyclase (GGDEF)-like protein
VKAAAVLGALAGILGITVAVTVARHDPFPALAPGTKALAAIAAGWLVMLVFAPWRHLARLQRNREILLGLARELREISAGRRTRRLSDMVLDRPDELGELTRAIHDTLARALAHRRESRMLQRTMTDTIRRETDRATLHLQREASTDPLTGLGNRRTMDQKLAELFGGERRRKHDNVVAMLIDIDLFKRINDTLGHDVGDECLRFLGNLLSSTLRGHDCAIRLGGDEFAVLMPNQTLEQTRVIAARLSRLFGQIPWPHAAVKRPTLSIGLANAFCREPNGSQQLLRRADAALYDSKEAGRARITTYRSRRGVA